MNDSPLPIRFGIIGCGALGLAHAERLSAMPNAHVTAVTDPDAGAMARVAEALSGAGSVEQFADYREMLRSAPLEAVSINSPNLWHVEQLLASLDRGLHVLCEKPLSMDPAEVEQVVSAVEKAGTRVAIAYQSRYRRDSRILRRALQSGAWGRVTSVDILTAEDWVTPNRGTWRHDPERCPGGFFADANGHQIDLLFWLTNLRPISVQATIENRGTPVPIVTWGEARLVEDVPGSAGLTPPADGIQSTGAKDTDRPAQGVPFSFMFVGDAKRWREEITIHTERADFKMSDTRLFWTDGSEPFALFPDPESALPATEFGDTPDGAFLAALRGGPSIVSPPHTVWPVLRFTIAALESARRGATLRI